MEITKREKILLIKACIFFFMVKKLINFFTRENKIRYFGICCVIENLSTIWTGDCIYLYQIEELNNKYEGVKYKGELTPFFHWFELSQEGDSNRIKHLKAALKEVRKGGKNANN